MNLQSNVTVIIPCYNDGQYIIEALNSILNQTMQADHIIIIDDGSDVKTKEVLSTINHPLVQIIYQENQGVCKARNTAIGLVETKYILNLDADDYFEPSFIQKAVHILDTNITVGVVGCFYARLKNGTLESDIIKPVGGTARNFLIKNNGAPSSMFRKQCWEEVLGYDEKMINGYEDWDFWFSIVKSNWKMNIIDQQLFTYRIKETSRDSNALANFDIELRTYIFLKHKEFFLEHFEFYTSEMIKQNSLLRNNVVKAKTSVDFKIGRFILLPLRFLKKTANK